MSMEPTPSRILARYLRVYPDFGEHVQTFIQQKHAGKMSWPAWCFLPLSGAAAIVQAEAARQRVPWQQAVADVGNLGAVIAWRQTKGIYRFDPTLYDALIRTPMDGRIPIEALFYLPEWCVWIDTPDGLGMDSPGFFAYLEHDAKNQRAELRFSICAGEHLTTQVLHLDHPTIEEAFAASLAHGAQMAASIGQTVNLSRDQMRDAGKAMAKILGPRLSLLLYLCADDAEIRDERTHTRTPSNPAPAKVKRGIKLFAAAQSTDWEVGFRIGPMIRAARAIERTTPQGGTHASPRAHVRAAHWHTFWTGPGRTKARVRWVWPTNVGTGKGELPAVVKRVKE